MEFAELVRRRRMVRRFQQAPIPGDLLDHVLGSALHAPSAGFAQGLALVVLEEPEAIASFWRTTRRPGFQDRRDPGTDPPVIVLPFADKEAYLDRYAEPDKAGLGMDVEEGWPAPYWDVDAAMAVLMILLTATDVGLGAWFFGIFAGESELLAALGVPPGMRPLGAIALGYPADDDRALGSILNRRRRPLAEIVHHGRW